MKLFTIQDIRSFRPCYDPSRHLPEDWSGTALDLLEHPTIPDVDKVWLMRQPGVMTDKGLRLFAVNCARRAQTYPKNYTPDPRTLAAIETVERFAEGLATVEELATAYAVARDAYAANAADAAAYAAANAARAAADAAANAANAAAYAAANAAAYAANAAYAVARDAYAANAAYDANAADAAANAAYDAERRKQVECLIVMTEKPGMFEVGK
jgi:hypothetical protein